MSHIDRSVVVVGASAAGLRCACRLARLRPTWQVGVVERDPVFSYAACGLPYALEGEITNPEVLRETSYRSTRDVRFFAEEKGVTVLTGWKATDIRMAEGLLKVECAEGERQLRWDELVLTTGARPRRLAGQPRHPRVCTFHRWEDLEPLRRGLERGEIGSVAIVGAGLVGCELAEAFKALWDTDVSLIETAGAPLPDLLDPELGACVGHHLETSGVRLLIDSTVRRVRGDEDEVTLLVNDGDLTADVAIMAVGVEPDVELARAAGARVGPTGALSVDDRLSTSLPHVWAAGDCVEVRDAVTGAPAYRPLGSLANRQGRTLANVLAGREDTFPPVVGATAVKVFDFNVAATGCTRERAEAEGLDVRSVWVTTDDRAHYWPEARRVHLTLVYERGTERVLGVQAAGSGEVVKAIDVATQLIARRAILNDLAQVEHAYAPPYAAAVDPLAVLARAAQNQEDGVLAAPPTALLESVVDVRLPEERKEHPAEGSRVEAVSVIELRSTSSSRTPPSGTIVCERGGRSAEATRLLMGQPGTRYLGGGLQWREAAGASVGSEKARSSGSSDQRADERLATCFSRSRGERGETGASRRGR